LAPPLNPLDILIPPEVVAVGRPGQPSALAGRLAGAAAFRCGAIGLVTPVAAVNREQLFAAEALAMGRFETHRPRVQPSRAKHKNEKAPPREGAEEDRKGEEGRRDLSESLEENPKGRTPTFKPPKTPHYQSAAVMNPPLCFCSRNGRA
jgi:hypothetical protein